MPPELAFDETYAELYSELFSRAAAERVIDDPAARVLEGCLIGETQARETIEELNRLLVRVPDFRPADMAAAMASHLAQNSHQFTNPALSILGSIAQQGSVLVFNHTPDPRSYTAQAQAARTTDGVRLAVTVDLSALRGSLDAERDHNHESFVESLKNLTLIGPRDSGAELRVQVSSKVDLYIEFPADSSRVMVSFFPGYFAPPFELDRELIPHALAFVRRMMRGYDYKKNTELDKTGEGAARLSDAINRLVAQDGGEFVVADDDSPFLEKIAMQARADKLVAPDDAYEPIDIGGCQCGNCEVHFDFAAGERTLSISLYRGKFEVVLNGSKELKITRELSQTTRDLLVATLEVVPDVEADKRRLAKYMLDELNAEFPI